METSGAEFVDPIVIFKISHGVSEKSEECLEIVNKASCILLRQFCKAGLLGIPIWAQDHWTLLVLRKGGKDSSSDILRQFEGTELFYSSCGRSRSAVYSQQMCR